MELVAPRDWYIQFGSWVKIMSGLYFLINLTNSPLRLMSTVKPPSSWFKNKTSFAPKIVSASLCSCFRDSISFLAVILFPRDPRFPRVTITKMSLAPSAASFAIVPPQPNSISSGCAPIAKTVLPLPVIEASIAIVKAFLLILGLAAFLRFFRLPELFVFEGDVEHHILLANTIVRDFHVIWVGVNVANLGFYHAPYWTYFTALWLYLSNGHPLVLAYAAAAVGVMTTGIITIAGWHMFNRKIGLMAGNPYASLPLFVFYDQKYWNPTPTMLLSLLILISLYFARKWPIFWLLFSAAYGAVFSTHFSLAPLGFLALYVFWRYKPGLKITLLSLGVFLVFIFPLIVFDYYQKGRLITTP